MSPARVGAAVPSEAELIEMERRAEAITEAEIFIEEQFANLDEIPYSLELSLERLRALRADVALLIELARERGGR